MTVLARTLGKTGEAAKSGPIGLAIILILCIACYFLFKSMSKHLKTVREDFPTAAGSSDAKSTELPANEIAPPETATAEIAPLETAEAECDAQLDETARPADGAAPRA